MSGLKQQYTKNAEQLRGMLERAQKAGKPKVNGFTIAQLEDRAAEYERIAALSEQEIVEHVAGVLNRRAL